MNSKFSYIITIISILCFASSCFESVNIDKMDINKLKRKIRQSGDDRSFMLLSLYYDVKILDDDYLDLALLMYHKYHNMNALIKIYEATIYRYNKNVPFGTGELEQLIKNVPKTEMNKALSYLEIVMAQNYSECFSQLSDYYLAIGNKAKSDKITEQSKEKLKSKQMKFLFNEK